MLILSSSPRRNGNSDMLSNHFQAGANETGNSTEKIFLRDMNINYCTGCGSCFASKKCSQKDDMAGILEKMISVDVIVMATPVYFYTMCGQMKTFIDRTCARYGEMRNKDFYFIVTAAVEDKSALERTLEEFRGFTGLLAGAMEKGVIYGTGAWNKGDVKGMPVMQEAFEMGKSI